MFKRLLTAALLCGCFTLLGAATDPRAEEIHPLASRISGTWQLQRQKIRITFEADGTYRAVGGRSVLAGRWSIVDDTHIATWTDDGRPKRVNAFHLTADRLIIIDDRGRFHKHRRVSPP